MSDSGVRADIKPDFPTSYAEIPVGDPYPAYAELRAACPVSKVRYQDKLDIFLVTRYEDARAVLTDPRVCKDVRHGQAALDAAGIASYRGGIGLGGNMLTADPPEHSRMRRIVTAAFTPRRVELMRPRIQEIVDASIDALPVDGVADLVADFALPVPITMISELLGIPEEDRVQFRAWTGDALAAEDQAANTRAAKVLFAYFTQLMETRRTKPGEDLLSALISANDEDRLSGMELLSTAALLLVAGYETTLHLIGNGMLALLRHPDQFRLARDRPELIDGVVEEILRYNGPVERTTLRFAAEDLELAGTVIPTGSVVVVAVESANRDAAAFDEPDRFDVTRTDNRHIGFGFGSHACLGAHLARLEARVAIGTLLRRRPEMALAVPVERLRWVRNRFIRGVATLPVRFTATGA